MVDERQIRRYAGLVARGIPAIGEADIDLGTECLPQTNKGSRVTLLTARPKKEGSNSTTPSHVYPSFRKILKRFCRESDGHFIAKTNFEEENPAKLEFKLLRFYGNAGASVPGALDYTPEDQLIMMEDLGTDNLLSRTQKAIKEGDYARKDYFIKEAIEYLKIFHEIAQTHDKDIWEITRKEKNNSLENRLRGYFRLLTIPEEKIAEHFQEKLPGEDEFMDQLSIVIKYIKMRDSDRQFTHGDCKPYHVMYKRTETGEIPVLIDFAGPEYRIREFDYADLLFYPGMQISTSSAIELCRSALKGRFPFQRRVLPAVGVLQSVRLVAKNRRDSYLYQDLYENRVLLDSFEKDRSTEVALMPSKHIAHLLENAIDYDISFRDADKLKFLNEYLSSILAIATPKGFKSVNENGARKIDDFSKDEQLYQG